MLEFNEQMISKITRIKIDTNKYSVLDTEFELGIHLINHNIAESRMFVMSQDSFNLLKQSNIDIAHETVKDFAEREIPIENFTYVEDKLYVDVDADYIDFDIHDVCTLISKNQYKRNWYEYPRVIVLIYDNIELDDDFEKIQIGSIQNALKRLTIDKDALEGFAKASDKLNYKKIIEDFEISSYKFNKKNSFIYNVSVSLSIPESELKMDNDIIKNNLHFYLNKHPEKKYKIESMELIDEQLFVDFKDSYDFDNIVDYSFGIGILPFNNHHLVFPSIIAFIEGDEDE